jgi:ABC-type nitrate/sulfonate/bicarbonate transport system substrate-binding protein
MNGGTWFDLAMERGGVRIIPGTGPYEINGQDSSWMGTGFREDFISSHPDVVKRYVTAVVKTKQIIWDYFKKNPDYVWKVYAEIALEKGGNPKLAKYYLPLPPRTTLIKDSDVQYWINVLVSVGQLKQGQISPADIYTNEFNPFYRKPYGKTEMTSTEIQERN